MLFVFSSFFLYLSICRCLYLSCVLSSDVCVFFCLFFFFSSFHIENSSEWFHSPLFSAASTAAVNHLSSFLSLNKEMRWFDRELNETKCWKKKQTEKKRTKFNSIWKKSHFVHTLANRFFLSHTLTHSNANRKMVERVKTIDKRGVDCREI